MPMNTPTILLYNLDNPRGAKIRRMCLSLRLRTALVPRESYGLPLGALALAGVLAVTLTAALPARAAQAPAESSG